MRRCLLLAFVVVVGCASPALRAANSAGPIARGSAPRSGGFPAPCPLPPTCDAPLEGLSPTSSWRHVGSATFTHGRPRHRARDLFVREGEPQWVLARFVYGTLATTLEDEDVDVFALRDCAHWELLGSARTTDDDSRHETVRGVRDDGGRVFFRVPDDRRLGVGLHRLRLVVRGDHSYVDVYVNVLAEGARIVVSDVDGTLTESESAIVWSTLLGSDPPRRHPGATDALWQLARRGYQLFYLTARPAWLEPDTHAWLDANGFPPGVVHTTLGPTGAMGAAAAAFKVDELQELYDSTHVIPSYAFGNRPSDVTAYTRAAIDPERTFYYRLTTDTLGGHHFDDYQGLIEPFGAVDVACH